MNNEESNAMPSVTVDTPAIWSMSQTMGVMVSNSPRQDGRKQFYAVEEADAWQSAVTAQAVAQVRQREATLEEVQQSYEKMYLRAIDAEQDAAAKQAEIDRLMLEFGPGEMTAEQVTTWEASQRFVPMPAAMDVAQQGDRELPSPYACAVTLLETFSEYGCVAKRTDGTPTPNADLCLRLAGELRALATRQSAETELRSATNLATAIWRDNYSDSAPNWAPLPDLMGVLSQIDNMVCGMSRKAAPVAAAAPKDRCKLCLGAKGGVPGNENVIGDVVVCDYCTSTLMDMKAAGWFGKSTADAAPVDAYRITATLTVPDAHDYDPIGLDPYVVQQGDALSQQAAEEAMRRIRLSLMLTTNIEQRDHLAAALAALRALNK